MAISPKVKVYVLGAAGGTAHVMWSIMAGQAISRVQEIRDAVRFVACVKNPESDYNRLKKSDIYSNLFIQQDNIKWDPTKRILNLCGLPIEVRTIEEAMNEPATPDETGIVVNFTKDETTNGTGLYIDRYDKIKLAIKPQAFKDDKEHWRNIPPGDHPHIIPNINNEDLRLNTQMVSQASCTTGGASTILKVFKDIAGFKIMPLSTLHTTHGATASDNAVDISGNLQMGETGANKALKIVFKESIDGIANLDGTADRGSFVVPSKIQMNLNVESDEELNYDKVHNLFVKAANDPIYRMMLGLYYPLKGEKKFLISQFKQEGRTAILFADEKNLKVHLHTKLETGKFLHSILLKKIIYDNVYGYVGNTIDLISLVINKSGVLPSQLKPIDKYRLTDVMPHFETTRRFIVSYDDQKANYWDGFTA